MPSPNANLLLVEDDDELLDLLTRWLDRRGIATCARHTVDDALEAAQSHSFEVAVVDGNLRGRSGIELVARLRQLQPGMEVIVISGQADDEARRQSQAAGAAEYVLKPFALAELHGVIDRLLPRPRDSGPSWS